MTVVRTADDDAVRLLARRPLARAELCLRLVDAGHSAAAVEAAVDRAERQGWVDDGKLAYDYVVTRSARLGRGRARLVAELIARGVCRDIAEDAWRRAVAHGEVDEGAAVATALSRRLAAGGRLDRSRYARVYNALLREGFERDEVESALAPHRALLERPDESLAERIDG